MQDRTGAQAPAWAQAAGGVVRAIDGICRVSGWIVAFAALATVVLCFAGVYLRYVLNTGIIWVQEIYIWTHVAVILLGAGYTMMTGGFVRVDIFYTRWSDRTRAFSDMALTILLLWPFMIVFGIAVWDFWVTSYVSDEGSLNPGGLENYWILKASLLGFLLLIGLQSLSFVLRGILVLGGQEQWALRHTGFDPDKAH